MQHARKDALARHDAVADLMIDLTVAVALLADLRDLEKYIPNTQTRADGQLHRGVDEAHVLLRHEGALDELQPQKAQDEDP